MKKSSLAALATVVITGFTACNNSENNVAKQDAANLSQYIDSVESAGPVYTEANWNAIDNGYKERATKAEAALEKMDAEDKAKTEASQAKYTALKLKYEAKLKESATQKLQ